MYRTRYVIMYGSLQKAKEELFGLYGTYVIGYPQYRKADGCTVFEDLDELRETLKKIDDEVFVEEYQVDGHSLIKGGYSYYPKEWYI